jgi:hypothetical protein
MNSGRGGGERGIRTDLPADSADRADGEGAKVSFLVKSSFGSSPSSCPANSLGNSDSGPSSGRTGNASLGNPFRGDGCADANSSLGNSAGNPIPGAGNVVANSC